MSTLTPFEAFKKFVAIRNHFSVDGYDFHRFNGKVKASLTSFEKRKDAFQFDRLARLSDLDLRIAATFVEGGKWVTDVLSEEGDSNWKKHKNAIQSLSYTFRNDLSKIDNKNIRDALDPKASPRLLSDYISKQVSLETLVVLDDFLQFVPTWQERFKIDPLIQKKCKEITQFRGFFAYDKPKISQVLVQKLHK